MRKGSYLAQKAAALAGKLVDAGILDDFRQRRKRRHTGSRRPGAGQERAQVRMIVGRGTDTGGAALGVELRVRDTGQHGVTGRGVDGVRVRHRADEAKFVGLAGQPGTQLADLDSRYTGGNGPEFAANLGGGTGFEIECVQMGRTAGQEKQDAAFGPAESGSRCWTRGAGPEQGRQRQAESAQGSDLQKRPA